MNENNINLSVYQLNYKYTLDIAVHKIHLYTDHMLYPYIYLYTHTVRFVDGNYQNYQHPMNYNCTQNSQEDYNYLNHNNPLYNSCILHRLHFVCTRIVQMKCDRMHHCLLCQLGCSCMRYTHQDWSTITCNIRFYIQYIDVRQHISYIRIVLLKLPELNCSKER